MIVQELLNLLPADPGTLGLIVALSGSLVGAGIWLLGARYSRTIITLLTVLLGATLGRQLPQWMDWNISGAGPAVGAALVLGVTGYIFHGMWVGIGLGTVLASWAAMGCWITFRHGAGWNWPSAEAGMTVVAYLSAVWQSLPADVMRILPYACGSAMVTGVAASIIWPKSSLIFGWSLAGTTLLAAMGVAAVDYGRPQWISNIPSPLWAQISLLGCTVALGTIIQWKLGPKPVAIGKPPGKKSKSDSVDDK